MLIIISIIFGNSLVIVTFLRFKKVRKVNNYYIFCLAIADFLTGLIAIPLTISNRLIISDFTCQAGTRTLFFLPAYMLTSVSVLLLVAITVDRYIAISRPLRYPNIMTRRKTIKIVLLMWILGLGFGSLPSLNFGSDRYQWVCELDLYESELITGHSLSGSVGITMVIVFILVAYGRIIFIAYLKKSTISWSRSAASKSTHDQMRTRTTVTCGLIVAAFSICWIPNSFKNLFENYLARDLKSLLTIQTACEQLCYINCCINPMIYGWRNHQFREAYKKIFRNCFGYQRKPKNLRGQTEPKNVNLSAISFKLQ
ncbi:Octopamine receptor beta-1R [Holothuria leucospilota]|uniref:Octopamine receptor beta-1R n=1 Tax=Holothuria leucospilota TaxID=206669 RepID=A0A9Q1BYS8_HOLLE|nr:Octopamine receptor beta-1R [Holothuria leucospilota]